MKLWFCLLIFLLFSCSSTSLVAPKNYKKSFSYHDVSGKFYLEREGKFLKNTLVTRSKLFSLKNHKTLEKSIVVSRLGTTGDQGSRVVALMPLASDFEVWLEGKKYSSKLRIDTKSKKMNLTTEGLASSEKWYGKTAISFPRSKYFCFYNQIPDCLYQLGFLQKSRLRNDQHLSFFVVWDSFPYVQNQLSNVGRNLFSQASIHFDKMEKDLLRYEVEIDGQLVLYYFSKEYDLVKIAWIAQGLTVLPPGEELEKNE